MCFDISWRSVLDIILVILGDVFTNIVEMIPIFNICLDSSGGVLTIMLEIVLQIYLCMDISQGLFMNLEML